MERNAGLDFVKVHASAAASGQKWTCGRLEGEIFDKNIWIISQLLDITGQFSLWLLVAPTLGLLSCDSNFHVDAVTSYLTSKSV